MDKGPGLPKPWQKLLASPYVTDTLFRLLGSMPKVVSSNDPHSRDAVAKFSMPDSIKVFNAPPSDYALTHEVGHMLDSQGKLPTGFVFDESKRPPKGSYAATNEDEHVAEAFARAMKSGRRGFADSTQAEKEMPGAIDIIHWLQTQPVFGGKQTVIQTIGKLNDKDSIPNQR